MGNQDEEKQNTNDNEDCEVDIFRDTEVRYLGYANEVGEAFRGIVPTLFVKASYIVASGYVLADAVHKGVKVYHEDTSPNKMKNCVLSSSDALIWQSFASVIIPGMTINRLCAAIRYIQCTEFLRSSSYATFRKLSCNRKIPTIIGLLSIPVIIHPIDNLVENVMNATYRQWTGFKPLKRYEST